MLINNPLSGRIMTADTKSKMSKMFLPPMVRCDNVPMEREHNVQSMPAIRIMVPVADRRDILKWSVQNVMETSNSESVEVSAAINSNRKNRLLHRAEAGICPNI